jgi:hypothetical protein
MKKSFLVIIVLLTIIYSCKKNDEQPATLLGKWYMHSEYAGSGWDATIQEGYSKQDYYLFNANNTVTRSVLLVNSDGSSETLTANLNYTFVQKDAKPSQVIISTTDRKNYYTILNLTKDSLKLSMRDTVYNQGVMYSNFYLLQLSRR